MLANLHQHALLSSRNARHPGGWQQFLIILLIGAQGVTLPSCWSLRRPSRLESI